MLETRIGGPLGAGLPLDDLLARLPSCALREIALTLGLNLGGAAHRDQLLALVSRTLRDGDFVRTVAAQAPARTGAILTRLASFGLPGVPGSEFEAIESRSIECAAERGLVILDGYQPAMPREVRLALRGADYRAPFQPVPLLPATTAADPRPGDAANAAMRALELTEAILHACAATPPRGLAELRLREIAPGVLVSVLAPVTMLSLLRQAGYVPAVDARDGTPFVDRPARRADPTRPVRAARRGGLPWPGRASLADTMPGAPSGGARIVSSRMGRQDGPGVMGWPRP